MLRVSLLKIFHSNHRFIVIGCVNERFSGIYELGVEHDTEIIKVLKVTGDPDPEA